VSTGAWAFIATAVLLPLLLAEFGDWCPWLAERIVGWSARRLGRPAVRIRYEEEWLANLKEVPGKLSRLAAALQYAMSVPRMRWSLRNAASAARDPAHAELVSAMNIELGSAMLEHALTHRSFASKNGGLPTNERLELIGDSVLGMVVTDTLFRKYPDLAEEELAKQRAAVLNMRVLADIARGVQLGRYIKLGTNEEAAGGRDRSSILADTLEAIIGAVYLDSGLGEADNLTHRLFDPLINQVSRRETARSSHA
jgi:dsRNA-specific ribonuclease